MGFRSLALQKRSSKVWHPLGAIKGELAFFAPVQRGVHRRPGGCHGSELYESETQVRIGRGKFIGTVKQDGADEERRADARQCYANVTGTSGLQGIAAKASFGNEDYKSRAQKGKDFQRQAALGLESFGRWIYLRFTMASSYTARSPSIISGSVSVWK